MIAVTHRITPLGTPVAATAYLPNADRMLPWHWRYLWLHRRLIAPRRGGVRWPGRCSSFTLCG
jgi:hypothetical protein